MVQFTKESIVLTIPTQSPFETWSYLLDSGYAVMENLLTIDQIENKQQVSIITHLLQELAKVETVQMMKIQKMLKAGFVDGYLDLED